MEFLVHNISHSDLIVELSWVRDADATTSTNDHEAATTNGHKKPCTHVVTADGASVPLSLLGRPKFSLFQQTSQAIMDTVEELLRAPPSGGVDSTLLSTACEQDAGGGDTAGGTESPTTRALHPSMLDIQQRKGRRWKARARCHDTQSPVGFKLDGHPIPVADLHDFQIRGMSLYGLCYIKARIDASGVLISCRPLET